MRVRTRFLDEARRWLADHGYLEVQVPILVTAAVEGGSTLFEVKYFDQKAYLTQSWQLYAEAMISGVGKIFTVAPSFRNGIKHILGGIGKPTTQGKIERWFRTYDLEHARFPLHRKFIQYYNYERPHMALNYSTPAEVYFGDVPNVL